MSKPDTAHAGNCVEMRHAIQAAISDLRSKIDMTQEVRQFMVRYLQAAINTPPRNCDVLSIEEAGAMYVRECKLHDYCSLCPYYVSHGNCQIAFLYAPYKPEPEAKVAKNATTTEGGAK